jgi:diguanylate cyclase (GGDEF)-like protein
MPEISKRLEKAERYLQKGKQDAALDEYLQALKEDPGNDVVRQTAAELSVAVGRQHEAARLFSALFEHQAAAGDTAKAVINYRKLARLGAASVEQTFRFAQLVEKTSRREALEAYQVAFNGFSGQQRRPEALAILKRILALDPSAENYEREGELAAEMGDGSCAAIAFLHVGMLMREAGDDPLPWYRRAHEMNAGNGDVALAYGKALHERGEMAEAIAVLEPFATAENGRMEEREAYARALMAANRLTEAEPVLWELFQGDPARIKEVGEMLAALLDQNQQEAAQALARKLEAHERKSGNQREFVALMKEIGEQHHAGLEFLEYMVEVYNASNREHDYCATLLKLFELYYAGGNFLKAADCLDRAAEVDAYEPGHQRRLEMLRGKIDSSHFNAIAARFSSVLKLDDDSDTPESPESESTVLEDLILQAEIFLQYSMRSRAIERLERIQKLFPGEEKKSYKLRHLYLNAGLLLQDSAGPAGLTPAGGAPLSPAPARPAPGRENAVDNFARISQMTRNIYRQGSVKGVLFTAVNEIGRHWKASRCIAGLCTPGKPPSATQEYCAPEVKPSGIMAVVKMVMSCLALAETRGTVKLLNASSAPELEPIREHIQGLGLESVLAVPLLDGEEQVGMLILEQCEPRTWQLTDEVVLKTIAEQMVLAVNNARLRSLVKTLAVTDERSGLLKRSSYVDVLLSEVKRAQEGNSSCTIMLMHFGRASALVKEYGEAAVELLIQEAGQLINGHIRQNDVAVRYERTTIALLLADTGEKNAFFVEEKLRKVLAGIHPPGKSAPLPMSVGIAQAVIQARFDPEDIVCELINRAEAALEAARAEGPNAARALAPMELDAAVSA